MDRYAGQSGGESSSRPASQIRSFVNAVYYPNWKVYKGQTPRTLNLGFVSHVFYAFAWPVQDGRVVLSDNYADNEIQVDGVYGCMSSLALLKQQHPHLKIVLSIGGGGQGSADFAAVARNDYTRSLFVANVKNLIDAHNFDGVDIDWEFPVSYDEGLLYQSLLTQLRQLLPSPSHTITAALPGNIWPLQNIPVEACSRAVDFFNVMAYDYYGPWTAQTGFHAQLNASAANESENSGSTTVEYLISKGVPSNKILIGIPAFGRSFLGAAGPQQLYTGHAGEDSMFEYKDLPRPGAQEGYDNIRAGAWCLGGDGGWVSYDNHLSVQRKAEYARHKRLGGLFYWTGTSDAVGPRSLIEAGYNELHEQ